MLGLNLGPKPVLGLNPAACLNGCVSCLKTRMLSIVTWHSLEELFPVLSCSWWQFTQVSLRTLLSSAEGRGSTGESKGVIRRNSAEHFACFSLYFFQDLDVRKSLKAAKDKLRHWFSIAKKTSLWAQAKRLNINILRSGDMTGTENWASDIFRQP